MYRRFSSAITILLLLTVGLGCSLLRPNRPLNWHIVLEIDPAVSDKESAVKQTVMVNRRRLDDFGVHHFEVLAQGTRPRGRIRVSLPDVSDRERLKELLTAAGKLELTAVISPPNPAPVRIYSTKEDGIASLGEKVPANRRVLPYSERDHSMAGGQNSERSQPQQWVVVEASAVVDGSELRSSVAVQSNGSAEDYNITFSLTPKGAERFGDWTGAHINDYLGVVLNDEIRSIAYIKSQITDQGEISGRFTKQSAEDLALVLRSGALPAPVMIVEEGPNR